MRGRRVAAWLTAPLGYLRRRDRLVSQWPDGAVSLGSRVALFCHFDPAGSVRPDVLLYIRELRASGFSVVAVANSGWLHPDAVAALRDICAAVLVRANSGRDFAAWREAMGRLALPRPETEWLLLANDSVHGPFAPLAPLLARMNDAADVWGMTDSDELGWHLQSYFLLTGQAVLQSVRWQRFWRGVRPLPSKLLTILWYEIGFSRCLCQAGFRLQALFPCSSVMHPDLGDARWAGQREVPLPHGAMSQTKGKNPTLAAWRALRLAGFPFVKREVLWAQPDALAEPLSGYRAIPARSEMP